MPDTPNGTKVLISFGAAKGGFEFAMQLRHDIYRDCAVDPEKDPTFCYLDAEALRSVAGTTYTYKPGPDTNYMRNPHWEQHYRNAMSACSVMVLLITQQWLLSQYCWLELDLLVKLAEERPWVKTVVVMWPDGASILHTRSWTESGGNQRNPGDLSARLDRLAKANYFRVGSSGSIKGKVAGGDTNEFAYSCSDPERRAILSSVTAGLRR